MTEQKIYEYLSGLLDKYPIVFHSPHYSNTTCDDSCPVCNMDIKLYDMVLELKRERIASDKEGL